MKISELFRRHIHKTVEGYSIVLRKGTVDLEVYDYVFNQRYHRPTQVITQNPVMLDLGSNIGLSIVDLKLAYPGAVIFGYEMDRDNFALALKNTRNLHNVHIHNKAIWHDNCTVGYSKMGNNDAYRLSEQVENIAAKEIVEATTISNIIADNKLDFIDYVKMDIEGAELAIFRSPLDWLAKVGEIKVEVHYDSSQFGFYLRKLEEYGFTAVIDTHHWSTVIGYRKNES